MATISNNGTTKNKPRLDHEVHSYIIDRSTNEKTYWRCIKYFPDRCRSRLHTCTLTNVIVKTSTEHTCKVDGTTLQLRIFSERVIHGALNTQETPDTIVTSCYRGKNKSFFFSNIFFLLIARYVRFFYRSSTDT